MAGEETGFDPQAILAWARGIVVPARGLAEGYTSLHAAGLYERMYGGSGGGGGNTLSSPHGGSGGEGGRGATSLRAWGLHSFSALTHPLHLLQQHRVPHAPVRDMQEVINDPHMHARGTLQNIRHPEYGDITVQHSPMHYEGVARMPLRPSSKAGADGRDVFVDWLGMPEKEYEALKEQGVL